VLYVFYNNKEAVENFYKETNSLNFSYVITKPEFFFNISGNRLPAIFLLQDNIIKYKLGLRTIDDNIVKIFFEN